MYYFYFLSCDKKYIFFILLINNNCNEKLKRNNEILSIYYMALYLNTVSIYRLYLLESLIFFLNFNFKEKNNNGVLAK